MTDNLLTINKKRNSSIELFRIIATFTVIITHFNGWFVGGLPESLDFYSFSWRWVQFFITAATCVCVNLFLIISGYFGLKFKISTFVHIFLILLSIYIPLYLLDALMRSRFELSEFLFQFLFITRGGYFVQCYLMLIFLCPLLNSFIKFNNRKTVAIWSVIFWMMEIWFGCIQNVESYAYLLGYSVIHFVLIYMLARVVFLYKEELMQLNKWIWPLGYIGCTFILWLMYGNGIVWDYANPFNVLSSFCLFMPFLYYHYYNKKINWIAKSTFAVYIIQVTSPVYEYLCRFDKGILNRLDYSVYLVCALVFIIVFFFVCILYDKLWALVNAPIERKIEKMLGAEKYRMSLFES